MWGRARTRARARAQHRQHPATAGCGQGPRASAASTLYRRLKLDVFYHQELGNGIREPTTMVELNMEKEQVIIRCKEQVKHT
jgi:hypothetical protein